MAKFLTDDLGEALTIEMALISYREKQAQELEARRNTPNAVMEAAGFDADSMVEEQVNVLNKIDAMITEAAKVKLALTMAKVQSLRGKVGNKALDKTVADVNRLIDNLQ